MILRNTIKIFLFFFFIEIRINVGYKYLLYGDWKGWKVTRNEEQKRRKNRININYANDRGGDRGMCRSKIKRVDSIRLSCRNLKIFRMPPRRSARVFSNAIAIRSMQRSFARDHERRAHAKN